MKKLLFALTIVLGFCFVAQGSWAARAYITDSFEVPLRTGPSTGNKILSLPVSGQALEVLETEGDWSHVRLLRPGGDEVEGWVPSRYLVTRIPWELQAKSLNEQNQALKEKLSRLDLQWGKAKGLGEDFAAKLKKKTEALDRLQAEYDSLRQGASDYLKLKTKYDSAKSSLENVQEQAERLTKENEKLRSSQRNKWFATGGLVLLCGMMIGLVVGRQQKKRKSSLYA